MDHRLQLRKTLEKINGVKNIYYAPTVNTKIEYPCIRYSLNRRTAIHADDKKYIKGESFIITFITRDVTKATAVLEQLEEIPFCNFDRTYVADGLYHYVYTKNY